MGTHFSLLLNWNCPFKNETTLERNPLTPPYTQGRLQSCESAHLCTAPSLQVAPVRIRDDTKPGRKMKAWPWDLPLPRSPVLPRSMLEPQEA